MSGAKAMRRLKNFVVIEKRYHDCAKVTLKIRYWGVDQTGAKLDKVGLKASPLFICELTSGHRLEFHRMSLEEWIQTLVHNENSTRHLAAIDCVLGLPQRTRGDYFSWDEILSFFKQAKFYGRDPAENLFNEILQIYQTDTPRGEAGPSLPPYPQRAVEKICSANSVFQTRPYQKNIQTGTYRILKEFNAVDRSLYSVFPFDSPLVKPITVLEGYPSLSWSQLLNQRSRKQSEFANWLKSKKILHSESAIQDPNFCDAAVMACHLKELHELNPGLVFPDPTYLPNGGQEGWILGAQGFA